MRRPAANDPHDLFDHSEADAARDRLDYADRQFARAMEQRSRMFQLGYATAVEAILDGETEPGFADGVPW